MSSEFFFMDRFKCHPNFYRNQEFGSYEEFIQNYAKYSVKTVKTNVEIDGMN